MLRQRFSVWLPVWGLLAVGLLAVAAVPAPSAEPQARDQKIADLEKQIQELARKLEELRRQEVPAVPGTIHPDWVKTLRWRSIGPASMGGRITALSIYEADPTTYWVATASGGLLKTTNNGTTFKHQFDKEATVSIGDVCVAPSDKNIVWIGTGEANPRNSVSYGDGVYKSTDGGDTWTNMGLKKSFQIGRVVVHPKNPDIVYVGALGRLYGPNEERGLYKTSDGGKTWQKILHVDDRTGVIDIALNPNDPETLLVATWERQRDGFDSHPGNDMPPEEGYDRYDPIKKWGPGSGLHKSTDGGKTWKKITQGLPTCPLGRIDLDYYRKDPRIVYAVIDSQKIGMGTPLPSVFVGAQSETAVGGGVKLAQIADNSPAAKATLKAGDVLKAIDKKELKDNRQLFDLLRAKKVGDQLALTVQRGKDTLELGLTLAARPADTDFQTRMRASNMIGILGMDTDDGPAIRSVNDDSPAAKAGLQEGDLLKALDKKPLKVTVELYDLLRDKKPGEKVTLQYVRDKETKEVTLTLQEPRPGFGPGTATSLRPYSFWYGGQRENVQDQQGPGDHEYGGVYKSTDGGDTWTRINSVNPRPMYFSQIRVDPSDDQYVYVLGISLYRSMDGGKTFRDDGSRNVHPDQHALWINPKDGRHMIVGCDGGFYVTYDRMDHWDYLNHLAIGQFYHVAVDSRRPYRVYGGLQDNGSWGGPTNSLTSTGMINEDWLFIAGGDGFVCRVDPGDPDVVYYESQDGRMGRRNLRTGETASIQPRSRGTGYRFNWNTPFILSQHNPRIFYCGGNYVFRSLKQGADLKPISPEVTRTKRGSATALAESPLNPEVLYVGTDDGYLWVTRDGGANWTNVTDRLGLPGYRWVATIEPSRYAEGRCYVVFDAHRSDDDAPYVFMTEDFGQSWKSLRANLPAGSTRCLREDLKNPNLLYLGTEFAAWASLNGGQSWSKINNNLPTVAIHEFALHPTAGEVVAATHGRSLWVLDVTALRQMTKEALTAKVHLYEPNTAIRWRSEPARLTMYGNGSRRFYGENPPLGAPIWYSLAQKAEKVSLKVVDFAGKTIQELEAKKEPGLHHVVWNLTRQQTREDREPMGGRRSQGFQRGVPVAPGMYRVVLTVDGQDYAQALRVEADAAQAPVLITPDGER
jgi:photosystem II stability/assembly factor-like uncharacterized protein